MVFYTLNMLADELKRLGLRFQGRMTNRRFELVYLAGRAEELCDSGRLYVCSYDIAREALKSGADCVCICPSTEHDTSDEDEGIITVCGVQMPELYNIINSHFWQLNSWLAALQDATIERLGLQALLDLSEDIIGNSINISDSTLNLLACTKRLSPKDDLSASLRELGYHSEANIRNFRVDGSFERWRSMGEDIYIHPAREGRLPCAVSVVKLHQSMENFIHIAVMFDNTELSDGRCELFRILTRYIRLTLEHEEKSAFGERKLKDFVARSIEGLYKSERDIELRASMVGLPLSGTFQVMVIRLPETAQMALSSLRYELRSEFVDYILTSYKSVLVVINPAADVDTQRLSAILERYDAYVGVSLDFHRISGLRDAWVEAAFAADSISECKGSYRLAYYRDTLLGCFMPEHARATELWENSYFGKVLEDILKNDQERSGTRLQILYTYLMCSCNAAECGNQLHMNRNNIKYHMSHISEKYGLDLTAPDERFNFLLAFKVGILLGRIRPDIAENIK